MSLPLHSSSLHSSPYRIFFLTSDDAVYALLVRLVEKSSQIIDASIALAQIDWSVLLEPISGVLVPTTDIRIMFSLVAFAEAAEIYDWTKPIITDEENVCKIQQCVGSLVGVASIMTSSLILIH